MNTDWDKIIPQTTVFVMFYICMTETTHADVTWTSNKYTSIMTATRFLFKKLTEDHWTLLGWLLSLLKKNNEMYKVGTTQYGLIKGRFGSGNMQHTTENFILAEQLTKSVSWRTKMIDLAWNCPSSIRRSEIPKLFV